MPLYKEWEPDAYTLAAIWKIDEPEDFFTKTGITAVHIKSDKKRIEHLAGRYLLQWLKNDFPLHHIYIDKHDKPRLHDDVYKFSISHSYPYVAAMVSTHSECGIDIQVWHRRMGDLQHKFLSKEEQEFFKNDPQLITLAWNAKEAAYKWLGKRGIDFIEHLPIIAFDMRDDHYFFEMKIIYHERSFQLFLEGFIEKDCSLAVTIDM